MAIAEALKEARKVLSENYVLEAPVDVWTIASNYGIEIQETLFPKEFSHVLGFITPNDDQETATMFINKADSEESKLFTIAHELGHWVLHKNQILKDPDKTILLRTALGVREKKPLEAEADAFAAELLVPTAFMEKLGPNTSIEELAKKFGVSKEVIGYHKKVISDENIRDNSQHPTPRV